MALFHKQYDACGPVSETTFVGGKVTRCCSDRTPAEPLCATPTRRWRTARGDGFVGPFFDRGLMLLTSRSTTGTGG